MYPISLQSDNDNIIVRKFDPKYGQLFPTEGFNPISLSEIHISENLSYIIPDRKGSENEDNSDLSSTPLGKIPRSCSRIATKKKTSIAAQAAITSGMTQPPSASEIDFDIHCPPLEPVLPPSSNAVCTISSNIGAHDVLCGRGGGTNTQIGNRRFRSLVQEFQPTYLLCRRKEKPLIARTIVLIIRNRGGRFLKKDKISNVLFEVGDKKAEAKTIQALREGLEVRATRSNSLIEKKKIRRKSKETQTTNKKASVNNLLNSDGYVNSISGPYNTTLNGLSSRQKQYQYEIPQKIYDSRSRSYCYHAGYNNQNYLYTARSKLSSKSSPPKEKQKNQTFPPFCSHYYTISPRYYPCSSRSTFPGGHHLQASPSLILTEEDSSAWAIDFIPPKYRVKKEGDRNNNVEVVFKKCKTREQLNVTNV